MLKNDSLPPPCQIRGLAFVHADAAMKELKKTTMLFKHQSKWNKHDAEISGIVNLYVTMLNKLTPLQKQVLRLHQQHGTQHGVAAIMGKSQQQIQYTLKSIQWESFDLAETAIKQYLKQYSAQIRNMSFA